MTRRAPPDTPEKKAADATKLTEAYEAIHPMAKAIPTLRQEVEFNLRERRMFRHRVWSVCAYGNRVLPNWRALMPTEKPELVTFLAALAAHKVLKHTASDAFEALYTHREWVQWAEGQMRARARREGIEMDNFQRGNTAEQSEDWEVKQEPQAASSATTLLSAQSSSPQQIGTIQPSAPKPAPRQQQTLLQQALLKSSQPSASESSTTLTAMPQPRLDEASVLPVKRSIECPAGAECPHPTNKKVKTNDVGCQTEPDVTKLRTQTEEPRGNQAMPPAGQVVQIETQPAIQAATLEQSPSSRENGFINAVEKLVDSNTDMQQSNRQLQHSFHASVQEMMAHGMYWQQRAIMMPAQNYYHQQPGTMPPPEYAGGRGWGGHPVPQIPCPPNLPGRLPNLNPHQSPPRAAARGRDRTKADGPKDRSKFFQ